MIILLKLQMKKTGNVLKLQTKIIARAIEVEVFVHLEPKEERLFVCTRKKILKL